MSADFCKDSADFCIENVEYSYELLKKVKMRACKIKRKNDWTELFLEADGKRCEF